MSASQATEPQHVRAAPSHGVPYPYYGRLAREQAFFRDDVNRWWVAASAAAVREVLNSGLCLTRPRDDLVPSPLADGPMADIFGRLVRLLDCIGHRVASLTRHIVWRRRPAPSLRGHPED